MPVKHSIGLSGGPSSLLGLKPVSQSPPSFPIILLATGQQGLSGGQGTSRGMTYKGGGWSIINDPNQGSIPPYGYNDWGYSAYFDGSKLVIGCGKDILSSTDGEIWTPSTSPFPPTENNASRVTGIAKGANGYVASGWQLISPYGAIASGDLGSWQVAEIWGYGSTWDVQYNGSIFLACGHDGNNEYTMLSSGDGAIWNAYHTPWDGGGSSKACWSPDLGLWVACGWGNNVVLCVSDDVSSWTTVMTGSISEGDIAWSDDLGLFIYCAGSAWGGHTVFTSSNGTDWTPQPDGNVLDTYGVNGACWSHELQKFYVAANNGGVWQSEDGTGWSRANEVGLFWALDIVAIQ